MTQGISANYCEKCGQYIPDNMECKHMREKNLEDTSVEDFERPDIPEEELERNHLWVSGEEQPQQYRLVISTNVPKEYIRHPELLDLDGKTVEVVDYVPKYLVGDEEFVIKTKKGDIAILKEWLEKVFFCKSCNIELPIAEVMPEHEPAIPLCNKCITKGQQPTLEQRAEEWIMGAFDEAITFPEAERLKQAILWAWQQGK